MKKTIYIFPVLMLVGMYSPAYAVNPSAPQPQKQQINSPSPVGNQLEIENQVKTQNQGEESQLQVNTQEQASAGNASGAGSLNRSQTAITNMSEVAKKVQELLQLKTTGGIGDQVRQVAREQNQAQTQIQEQLTKIDSKSKLARIITGTDLTAIKNLKAQLEQNQLRVKQLEKLQTQLTNKGDLDTIQATIESILQENTALQEKIMTEEQTKSLFGWLFKLFMK